LTRDRAEGRSLFDLLSNLLNARLNRHVVFGTVYRHEDFRYQELRLVGALLQAIQSFIHLLVFDQNVGAIARCNDFLPNDLCRELLPKGFDGNAGFGDGPNDLIDRQLIVFGDVLERSVDVSLSDADLVLVGLLKLKHFVFERTQNLQADLRQGFLCRSDTRGRKKEAGALLEVVFRDHEIIHDRGNASRDLRRGDLDLLVGRRSSSRTGLSGRLGGHRGGGRGLIHSRRHLWRGRRHAFGLCRVRRGEQR
jgi:hypothetical protein